MKAQQIIDNQEEKEEPKKISEPVIDKHAKIKVPGYSQEFSKAHIEYNRAFMDPKLRT